MSTALVITVCQLEEDGSRLEDEWRALADEVGRAKSDLLILPELPFCSSFVKQPRFDHKVWESALAAHERWEARLAELGVPAVVATRPIDFGAYRYEEAFVWSAAHGTRSVHTRTRFQDQAGASESSWFHAADPDFTPANIEEAAVGFLVGSEIWAFEQAARFRDQGIDLLVSPLMTCVPNAQAWAGAGRRAAEAACAIGLSSGRIGHGMEPGGCGWIVAPDGEMLATTSKDQPAVSMLIDLVATRAFRTTAA